MTDGYFDITNKYSITPEVVPMFGVPECVIVGFFNGTTSFDCTPTEVKVRHSFVKPHRQRGLRALRGVVRSARHRRQLGQRGQLVQPRVRRTADHGVGSRSTASRIRTRRRSTRFTTSGRRATRMSSARQRRRRQGRHGRRRAREITQGYAGAVGLAVRYPYRQVHDPRPRPQGEDERATGSTPTRRRTSPTRSARTARRSSRRARYEELTESPGTSSSRVSVATRREVECRRTGDGDRETCHGQYFEGSGAESTKQMVKLRWLGYRHRSKAQTVDKTGDGHAGRRDLPQPRPRLRPADACGKPGEVDPPRRRS